MNTCSAFTIHLLFLVIIRLRTLIKVAAQEDPVIVIARPGEDVELMCTVKNISGNVAAWLINNAIGPYTANAIRGGQLDGYSVASDVLSNNLIVENIVRNDDRNNSDYKCVIVPAQVRLTLTDIIEESDPTILYVAGVPAMVPNVILNRIINNGNNITLTLSWGEPFNNLDPIVSYTVSCSGDDACPPNFTTTDNTTRSYIITNLTPMTNYTFSVVATNSVGSGEAGVVMITTPSGEIITTTSNVVVNTSTSTVGMITTTSTVDIIIVTSIVHMTTTTPHIDVNKNISSVGNTITTPRVGTTTATSRMSVAITSSHVSTSTIASNISISATSSMDIVTAISNIITNTSVALITTSSVDIPNATSSATSSDDCDSNYSAVVIGAVVGVDCVIIILMVITNIMIWIYCLRKRHHTELQSPTKDAVNPGYQTITYDQCKRSEEESTNYYEEVKRTPDPDVKMTSNPAYSVP